VENYVEIVENSCASCISRFLSIRPFLAHLKKISYVKCQKFLIFTVLEVFCLALPAYFPFSRWATTLAAFTPEAPACAKPRVTPAPSFPAKPVSRGPL
jgi:hypothetical protein